jgi:hypothetical protein
MIVFVNNLQKEFQNLCLKHSFFWLINYGLLSPQVHIVHCTENPVYVFPEMELWDLDPNSYINVSVIDLYIPRIGLPIWLQQNRQTNSENI